METKITNLKDSPELKQQTLKLIEDSFEYQQSNSFATDFYPLFNSDNFANCLVLIRDKQVLAHLGRLSGKLQLAQNTYSFSMYGGIAVAPEARGKGYFKRLFEHSLKQDLESTFSLLWSDQLDLYKKFSFSPCIDLNSYIAENNDSSVEVVKTAWKDLSSKDFSQLQKLYLQNNELRMTRSPKYWRQLASISSCCLYLIKEKDQVKNYFIKNKGQDLQNIIHEYGFIDEDQLRLMRNYGTVWSTYHSSSQQITKLYGSLMKINNHELFKNFIYDYSKLKIKEITQDLVNFEFAEKQQSLTHGEFLAGIFGPHGFSELKLPPLYICGLDSI